MIDASKRLCIPEHRLVIVDSSGRAQFLTPDSISVKQAFCCHSSSSTTCLRSSSKRNFLQVQSCRNSFKSDYLLRVLMKPHSFKITYFLFGYFMALSDFMENRYEFSYMNWVFFRLIFFVNLLQNTYHLFCFLYFFHRCYQAFKIFCHVSSKVRRQAKDLFPKEWIFTTSAE